MGPAIPAWSHTCSRGNACRSPPRFLSLHSPPRDFAFLPVSATPLSAKGALGCRAAVTFGSHDTDLVSRVSSQGSSASWEPAAILRPLLFRSLSKALALRRCVLCGLPYTEARGIGSGWAGSAGPAVAGP